MQTKTEFEPERYLSNGIRQVPTSFIREILKVTADPSVISFAGGLPHSDYLPLSELAEAAHHVLAQGNKGVLQYSVSEGFQPLREWIAGRYSERFGFEVGTEEVLITTGSQQALDLIGKVFLNDKDPVIMEKPSYLGAIQAFSTYNPMFLPASLEEDGVNIEEVREALWENPVKFCYCIPNFQNPSGISYSLEKRKALAGAILAHDSILVEDDPYSELFFRPEDENPPIKQQLGSRGILLGSFSKIVSPGLRLGWVVADPRFISLLVRAKQVSDLHSNNLSQQMIYHFLTNSDFEGHLRRIRQAYHQQKELMQEAIVRYFPSEIHITKPKGGMFLWVTLPEHLNADLLIKEAVQAKVLYVPGNTFFTDGTGRNTFRLNFSNAGDTRIDEGIRRLGVVIGNHVNEGISRKG